MQHTAQESTATSVKKFSLFACFTVNVVLRFAGAEQHLPRDNVNTLLLT